MPPVLVAEKLVKKYSLGVIPGGRHEVEALSSVDLIVDENEVAVLLGPNGSGKSTFMKIAAGILQPTSGRLTIFGKEPYLDIEVRGRISYMPQDLGLYGSLTGYENYIFYSSIQGVDKGSADRRLKSLKEELDLGEWFYKRRVTTYSGGMKRKTSLAVALASDPDILILDEPTTGLDPSSRRVFWEIAENLKSKGKTIVLATHLFEDAEYLADKIVIMYQGKIITSTPPSELRRKIGYRYSIDIEFTGKPSKHLLERLRKTCGELIFSGGYRVTLVTNNPESIRSVEKILDDVKYLSLSLRRISLGDIYFLLTGVKLK